MKHLVIFLSSLLMLSTACSKEEAPVLIISQTELYAPHNGNSAIITLTANNPWFVSGTDWCTVSPSRGEGIGEEPITVTVKDNTTYDSRNCTLTFTSLNLSQTLSISQGGNFGIVLPNNTYEISSDRQQIFVEVKANVDYEVDFNVDWIKLNGTKALSSTTYIFDIEKNNTYDSREGIITIKGKDSNNSETIKVKQVQLDAILISSKEHNLSFEEQSIEIKLQTNVDLEVVIPDNSKSWITHTATRALLDKTLVFDIKANDGYDSRSAEIIIKENNSTLADTLIISQAQKDAIIISQKEYELTSESHALEIKLQTNVDVDIIVPKTAQNWISYIETKALTDKTVVLGVKANDTYEFRECEILIKNKTTALQETIKVMQLQNEAIILSSKEYKLSSEAQSLEVELQTNIDFNVIIPDNAKEWITHIETKALTDKTLVFDIKENLNYDERNCNIIVQKSNSYLADTIKIMQVQKDAIIMSQKEYELSAELHLLEVKLQTNVDLLDVIIPGSAKKWISFIETKALQEKIIILDVKPNDTYSARESNVIIKNRSNALQDTIHIKQLQNDAIILNPKIYDLNSGSHILDVQIQTNIDIEVVIPEEAKNWVSLIQTKALESKTVSFNISENTDANSRECKILFNGLSLTDTLILKQGGNTIIKFECSNFKNFLVSKYDTNGDDEISINEALNVKDISGVEKISSLKGIEYMGNLERLVINAELLDDVDVSHNKSLISLGLNNARKINNLNISENLSLRLLNCSELTFSPNCSNNLALESIIFTDCPGIQEIDLSNLEMLSSFSVRNIPIRAIDFSNNLKLSRVSIAKTDLKDLKFSNNSKLQSITITDNNFLESVDLQKNNEEWLVLQIQNSPVNNLDLSNCKLLWSLLLSNIKLSKFDISNNYELESLQVGNIGITLPSVNLDHIKNLKTLVLKLGLESIDLTKHTELERLGVTGNKLKELCIDNNKKLKYLECSDNEITKLNLGNNIILQHMVCNNNQMVSLDISKTKISFLRCSMPSLKELFIKHGEKIEGINVNRYFHPYNDKDFYYIHRCTDIKYVSTPYVEGDYVDEYGINHGKGITIDGITWAPVNCGYNESDNHSLTYGRYYQWGRHYGQRDKDMVENAPVNYSDGNMLENSHVYYNGGYETSRWDWHKSPNGTLWNSNNDNLPVKTKNDPCPQGWRVPTKEEIAILTTNYSEVSTDSKGQKGVFFTGQSSYSDDIPKVFLPLAGNVGLFGDPSDYSVDIWNKHSRGIYWTSNADILNNWYSAYCLDISVGYYDNNVSIDVTQTGRSNGYSVRCVKE